MTELKHLLDLESVLKTNFGRLAATLSKELNALMDETSAEFWKRSYEHLGTVRESEWLVRVLARLDCEDLDTSISGGK